LKFGDLDETSFKNGSLQLVGDLVAESENVRVLATMILESASTEAKPSVL